MGFSSENRYVAISIAIPALLRGESVLQRADPRHTLTDTYQLTKGKNYESKQRHSGPLRHHYLGTCICASLARTAYFDDSRVLAGIFQGGPTGLGGHHPDPQCLFLFKDRGQTRLVVAADVHSAREPCHRHHRHG